MLRREIWVEYVTCMRGMKSRPTYTIVIGKPKEKSFWGPRIRWQDGSDLNRM
jgi:hypothetical protein